jgi:hypothetical protein
MAGILPAADYFAPPSNNIHFEVSP